MVPANFTNYFLALAGAGGALIGLLFVAISIQPERIFGAHGAPGAPGAPERQTVATNTFAGLVNGFFIALLALVPGTTLGAVTLAFALLGVVNALLLGGRRVRVHVRTRRGSSQARINWLRIARFQLMVLISLGLYVYEGGVAVRLLQQPADLAALATLCDVLVVVYGLALLRAWELLGAPRTGLLGWLNPLADLEKLEEDVPSGAA
jgi:hypothetical protein